MRRLYFVEVLVLANLVLVALVAHSTFFLLGSALASFLGLVAALAGQALVGIGVRALIAFLRRDRSYRRRLRRRQWWIDTARLVVAGAAMVFGYGWLKLSVPMLRDSNFDQALWSLDQMLGFGAAPTVFLLDLFRGGRALRAIDWAYANILYVSLLLSTMFFLSHPSRRIRIAFSNGNAVLWLMGAWLYFLIPSLGPAYRFPDIWFASSADLPITQSLQAMLMRNWQTALRSWEAGGLVGRVSIAFGIAAFPSLHVGAQTYVFLWMRKLWLSGQVLFGVFTFTIFLGSMVTGWHYLVDGIVGMAMAIVVGRFAMRRESRLFSKA